MTAGLLEADVAAAFEDVGLAGGMHEDMTIAGDVSLVLWQLQIFKLRVLR